MPFVLFAESNWNRQIDSILKIEKPFWNFNIKSVLDNIPENKQQPFLKELIDRADKEKKYQLAGRIYLSMPLYDGISIYNQDQYSQFFKAIEYFKKDNLYEGIIEANIYIGLNYKSLDELETMGDYFREANRVAQSSDKEYVKLTGYWTMFELMNFLDKLDSSKYYMKLCDSLYPFSKFPTDREKVHADVLIPRFKSIYYAKLNQFDSAAYYFKISLESNFNSRVLNTGNFFIFSPRDNQANLEYLTKYLDESEITGFQQGIVTDNTGEDILYQKVYRTFADYYVEKKMYDSAIVYYQKAFNHYDSAYYKDPRVALSKLEQEKAEIEFRAKEQLAAQQRNYIFFGAVIILIVLLLITWFIYSRYKDKARINEKLNELNTTKDKLFAIISHDLRSPLASLKQMLELISLRFDKLSDNDKQMYINNLRISSNKMYLMLDNLLNWAKMNLGKFNFEPKAINLNQIVNVESDLLQEAFNNKSIDFELHNKFDEEIEADHNLLSIAIRNLLSNAIKYSPNESKIECRIYRENGSVCIAVKDYGAGMNSDTIHSILNDEKIISQNGTSNEKGNGLGLMITREVVNVHKGEIKIVSEKDKFTEITLLIPHNLTDK